MRRLFELREIPTDVVLRALAIASVVNNHTLIGTIDLGGGMAFLVMLSGMNFARFAVKDGHVGGIRQAIVDTAWRLFVPSLVMVLLTFAVNREFDLHQVLFIQNWTGRPQGLRLFPAFYAQLLLQLMAGLFVLSWIPAVARATVRRPGLAMLVLFGVALLLRACGDLLSINYLIRPRLPLSHIWTFALGAVIFFFAADTTKSRPGGRWLAWGCVLVGTMVGYSPTDLRFWWLIASGSLLVSVRYIPLPSVLVGITMAVSAATFGIFLTHVTWFHILRGVHGMWLGPQATIQPLLLFFFGVLLSTLTWAAFTAFGRAYRALQPAFARPILAE
jgi:hypothetical protein